MAGCHGDYLDRADVTDSCLNFVLRHFLPVSQLLVDTKQQEERFISRQSPNLQPKIILSGSAVEGLNVPLVIGTECRGKDGHIKEIVEADLDMMIIVDDRPATYDPDDEGAELYIHPLKHHPGYVKLEVVDPDSWKPQKLFVSSSGKTYLKSSAVVENTLKILEKNDPDMDVEREIAGPAIKNNKRSERPEMKEFIMEWDTVMAFPCPTWPPVAREWATRERHFDWPEEKIIEKIVAGGCHIVSVGAPESRSRDIEFRLSFSVPEKRLAKSLNPTQRQCYILLKILQAESFKYPKLIKSYHLKNILFWVCEDIPADEWGQRHLADRLHDLLDRLIECLSEGYLPHYFIKENNLIAHADPEDIHIVLEKVEEVRRHPLKYLFDFNRKNKFHWGPFHTAMADIMGPLIEWHQSTQDGDSQSMYVKTRDRLALVYIDETWDVELSRDDKDNEVTGDKHDLCVKRFDIAMGIFRKNWEYLTETNKTSCSFAQYLTVKSNKITSLIVATRFHWFLVDEFQDPVDLSAIYGSLGCLYHEFVYRSKRESDKDANRWNARKAFKEAIRCHEDPALLADYGNFLTDFRQYDDAITVLERVLEGDTGFLYINEYGTQERNTVDDPIRETIQNEGPFKVHSVVLAHYLLVKCYKVTGNGNQVKHMMYSFRKLCNEVMENTNSVRLQVSAKFLLGVAYKNIKRLKPALKAFDAVLELDPFHVTARDYEAEIRLKTAEESE